MQATRLRAVSSFALLLSGSASGGGLVGPGSYEGYVARDRWGQWALHQGERQLDLFLQPALARRLARYGQRPLRIQALRVVQPRNPGAAMIVAIGDVTALPVPMLRLDLRTPSSIKAGQRLKARLTIKNLGAQRVWLEPQQLALVLTTRTPAKIVEYWAKEGRSFWYYGGVLRRRGQPTLSVRAHQWWVPWDPKAYLAHARAARLGARRASHRPPGYVFPIELSPGGSIRLEVDLAYRLPAGSYELFAYRKSHRAFSVSPYAQSVRQPVTVLADNTRVLAALGSRVFRRLKSATTAVLARVGKDNPRVIEKDILVDTHRIGGRPVLPPARSLSVSQIRRLVGAITDERHYLNVVRRCRNRSWVGLRLGASTANERIEVTLGRPCDAIAFYWRQEGQVKSWGAVVKSAVGKLLLKTLVRTSPELKNRSPSR